MSIRLLSANEWPLLRTLRLAALRESPDSFLSHYDAEAKMAPADWKDEAARGIWLAWYAEGQAVAVLGATPEPDVGPNDRYLSYLWVAPPARRSGIATKLVTDMLHRLGTMGVRRAWLWVLDGNEAALSLYLGLGFRPAGDRQPLSHDPGRSEERLSRELS